MEADAENGNLQCYERSSAQTPVAMEYQPRATISSSATHFRFQRLLTVQELVLEYSLAIVVLGCFLLLSLSLKVFRDFSAFQDGFTSMKSFDMCNTFVSEGPSICH